MKRVLLLFGLVACLGCKDKSMQDLATNSTTVQTENLEEGVTIIMEDKTYVLPQEKLYPFQVNIESDSLSYTLRTKDSDVSLSLNLINTGIVAKANQTFNIPEDYKNSFMVGLSFFNKGKDVDRLNKRIVFRKGTITIKELTANRLKAVFEGEGSGMRDANNRFPINGSINIKY